MVAGPDPVAALVRLARRDDVPFLVELSAQVFRPYGKNPRGTMISMLRDPHATVLVAETADEDQIRLGFGVVVLRTLDRDFGPLTRPRTAHLDAIAVRPSLQRRGVGMAILEAAIAKARSEGAISMSLQTAVTNLPAQRLFHAAGFRPLGALGDAYQGGQPILTMMKAL